ncbi:hypothetical protein LX64_04180 [Chitinophaga skermanii]|uniref:Lipoprotein n=1 Tax=Chitinophaga skermanii TaxID=331697 RepID=A0A327Q9B7_9BACT|nr:hypothetical protein [Chitinophaga skermanii]RAJ00474.1 hypothetical protein LX64_04180 [Chitinophaga skermanii]
MFKIKFTITWLTVLVLISCSKDINVLQSPTIQNYELSVSEAKSWWKSIQPIKHAPFDINGRLVQPKSKIIPNWNTTFAKSDGTYNILSVSLNGEVGNKIRLNDNVSLKVAVDDSNSKAVLLLFKKNGSDNIVPILMHINASNNSLASAYDTIPQNFTGSIIYTTIGGKFLKGYEYNEGIISRVCKPIVGNNYAKLPGETECRTVELAYYSRDCYTYSDGTEICTPWTLDRVENITSCQEGGVSGGIQPDDHYDSNQFDVDFGMCPEDFLFTQVTGDGSWQECGVKNIKCTVYSSYGSFTIEIESMFVGMPFKDEYGTVKYSHAKAMELADRALSQGQSAMFAQYRENIGLTPGQLSKIWFDKTKELLSLYTNNTARVGTTGSIKAIQPIPVKTYERRFICP